MPSEFETALREGIRDIVDSDLGQVVTYIQPAGEFELNIVWREGDSVEQVTPQAMAMGLVSLEDFVEDPRVAPSTGDQVRKDGKVFEVREVKLNGVGGAWLFFRLLRREA